MFSRPLIISTSFINYSGSWFLIWEFMCYHSIYLLMSCAVISATHILLFAYVYFPSPVRLSVIFVSFYFQSNNYFYYHNNIVPHGKVLTSNNCQGCYSDEIIIGWFMEHWRCLLPVQVRTHCRQSSLSFPSISRAFANASFILHPESPEMPQGIISTWTEYQELISYWGLDKDFSIF